MGILDQVFAPISFRSGLPIGNSGWPFPLFGGVSLSDSAKKVNENSALSLGAFYNAVDLCTNDIAKLPKAVYKKTDDNREKLSNHPVHKLISREPNQFHTSFNYWKYITYCAIVKGNGYAFVSRDKNTGEAVGLLPIEPEKVTPVKGKRQMFYRIGGKLYDGRDIFHIYFWSTNGYSGTGVVAYAANSLGINIAGQEYMGNTFGSKGMSHGVMEADHDIQSNKKQEIEKAFQNKLSQDGNHKVALLDAGFKYKNISITPAEAQWLETDTRGVIAVCQFLNVAPHKLKLLDKANYSNLQLMTIEHQQDSVMPRTVNIEQELDRKLFSNREKIDHYVKFNLRSQLRGDQKTEAEYLKTLVTHKMMTPNEGRKYLELNPKPGGDELLQMVNMTTDEQLKKEKNE